MNFVREQLEMALQQGHVGVVAGVVAGDGTYVSGAGTTGDNGRTPDARTLFRIASLSKVLTGTALAIRVRAGDLRLRDSAQDYLPDYFRLPAGVDGPIRLEHLATHSSGLPRGLDVDPFASIVEYGQAFSGLDLAAAPGTTYAYSNIGAQVIGMVLTGTGTRSFDPMLRESFTDELRLSDIVAEPTDEQRTRIAGGHDETGTACETPYYPHGVASGGLYGTVADLLAFLRAHWDPTTSRRTAEAMALAVRPRANATPGNEIGLFWHVGAVPDGAGVRAVWHNGSLPGYRSFLGFMPAERIGVAVLTNTQLSVDGIGAALLREAR